MKWIVFQMVKKRGKIRGFPRFSAVFREFTQKIKKYFVECKPPEPIRRKLIRAAEDAFNWHGFRYPIGMGTMPYYKMGVRLLALWLGILFATQAVRSEILTCDICGKPLHKVVYNTEDRVEGKNKRVCQGCEDLQQRCFICNLPVREGFQRLPDGRFICARELKTIVASDKEALGICKSVKNDLDKLLSRFLTMPADGNIQLTIADKYHLQNLFSAPGSDSSCVWVYGATSSHSLPNNKFVHTVDVLSHLQKPRLMAVCAHEYTHAWMGENLTHERRASLDKNTLEAFCELVAFKYMESLHEQSEMENIKQNHYTVGQILVLIEADKKYGFNTVIDWMKNGEDTRVDLTDLDRIRSMRDHRTIVQSTPASGLVYGTAHVPTPVPDTLLLKSISGSGQHRFAMINSTTFELMERAKVRVSQTNVTVKCLEIGKDFVTIQVDGSPEKKQLFLRVTQ